MDNDNIMIIDDEIIKTKRNQVSFDELDDKIDEIQMMAEECFDSLYDKLISSNSDFVSSVFVVPSVLVGVDIHEISYYDFNSEDLIKYKKKPVSVKVVNPSFRNVFENKLRNLAKNTMTYMKNELMYDEEMELKYYNLTLYTEKAFEEEYGQSLYSYYFPRNVSAIITLEDQYRNMLEGLRHNYIKFVISDKEKGVMPDFVEQDGYMSLLMINNKYKNLPNKELIQNELGFLVDDEKKTLKLIRTRK